MMLTHRLSVLTLLFFCTTTTFAGILPGNLLPNPSVELDEDLNGIPDGWLLGGNNPSGDIWDTSRPVSGERNLLLFDDGNNSFTSWYTNVDIPADTDELEFQWTWAYEFTSDNASDEFRMTVAWRSEGRDIGFTHVVVKEDESEYITENHFFVVPDGADALRLEFVTGGPQTETGVMYVDDISIAIPGAVLTGDYNENGVLDAPDIDLLAVAIQNGMTDAMYDLNDDSVVDASDAQFWIKDLANSWIGDANVDGEFNSSDLVEVLASGTYEQDVAAVWSTGDFTINARTDSGDLVVALADGGYENGVRGAVAAVPEPTGIILFTLGLCACYRLPRGRSRFVLTQSRKVAKSQSSKVVKSQSSKVVK